MISIYVLPILSCISIAFILVGQLTNSILVSNEISRNDPVCDDSKSYDSLGLWKTCTGCSSSFPDTNCDYISCGTGDTNCYKLVCGGVFAVIGTIFIILSFMGIGQRKFVNFVLAVICGVIILFVTSKRSLGSYNSYDEWNYGPTYWFIIIFTVTAGICLMITISLTCESIWSCKKPEKPSRKHNHHKERENDSSSSL
jgi:hypothetical protein